MKIQKKVFFFFFLGGGSGRGGGGGGGVGFAGGISVDVNEEFKFLQGIHRRMALVVNCFCVCVCVCV